ncbi:TNT domain-containing protein [Prauserella cavernicola]|uniref:TNT domain-containing protein n=1 Tax=Prauserella cavernicola TaxID=2800127 RepID=A0A934V5G7_9PSEU|nr:TNT domain-containing protein [Prauserella cavernicola]MBK1784588.1 TNT domain-containing protein [Prauserella cavernicola]
MRYRAEVADRPDALYALWNGRIFRARRSTADESVLLVAPAGEPPEGFDTEWNGSPAKVVPAAEANATFAIHTYASYDDEPYRVEPRSGAGELTLRWAGRDERVAAELGLTDFTAATDDPESLSVLWQERHDFAEEGAPRTTPGSGDTQALLRAIGRTILSFLPSGWQRVGAQFRQVGDYSELEVRAVAGDVAVSLSAPPELGQLFAQLRSAMYEPDTGTWFQGTFTLDSGSNFDFDYDADTEPSWRLAPAGRTTARSYEAELGYYPRKHAPAWLTAKAGLPLDVTLRHARVVDSHAEGEKPVVNRPPVPQDEAQRILGYLYRAPVAAGRPGSLPDIFVPGGPPNVPDAFHTDGVWVWPAAVPHYLRKYGVPPEADLLDHIRAQDYRTPYVPRRVRATAEAEVAGRPHPPQTAEDLAEPDAVTRVERGQEPKPALRASEVLAVLRTRLAEYGVAQSAYRVGERADGAWCLSRTPQGWEVARYDGGEPVEPAYFARAQEAAQALLGAVLLLPGRTRLGAPEDAEAHPHVSDWPIMPLRGEPPLTYFHGKRLVTLPEGTVVLRYGNEGGNVVHPEGTPFQETSLAFDRENEVHHYEVRRPLHVLTGVTRPWGPLPGGAVAYLLPRAIGHHVESGALERRS